MNIIKDKSIKTNEIDWDEFKNSVADSIKHYNSNEDVYRAISYTVILIDDGHSIFLNAQTPNKLTIDTVRVPDIISKMVEGNIGFIKLMGFIGNIKNSRVYSQKIRKSLYELDSASDILGRIIDLRENMGGLSSMMPLGLAPLFQNSAPMNTIVLET